MLTLTCSLLTRCTRHPELRVSWHRVAHCGCALANQRVVLSAPRVCECRACVLKRSSLLCVIASTPLDNTREVRDSSAKLERARRAVASIGVYPNAMAAWAQDYGFDSFAAHDACCQRAQARVPALEIAVRRAAERASEQAMPSVLQKCEAMRALIASQNTSCDGEAVLTAALVRRGLPRSDAANWLHLTNSRALHHYRAWYAAQTQRNAELSLFGLAAECVPTFEVVNSKRRKLNTVREIPHT